MNDGLQQLASGAVFRLRALEASPLRLADGTDDEVILLAAASLAAQGFDAGRELRELAAGLRAEGDSALLRLGEVLEFVRETRGLASDYLLARGVDDLSEAGESYLRSSEWAKRALRLAPWAAGPDREQAAGLVEHMAGLEEEAAEALLRWRESR